VKFNLGLPSPSTASSSENPVRSYTTGPFVVFTVSWTLASPVASSRAIHRAENSCSSGRSPRTRTLPSRPRRSTRDRGLPTWISFDQQGVGQGQAHAVLGRGDSSALRLTGRLMPGSPGSTGGSLGVGRMPGRVVEVEGRLADSQPPGVH